MPCDSSYMAPTEKETQSRLTAKLIVHVCKFFNVDCEPWIHEAAEHVYGNIARLDELVITLCGILSTESDGTKAELFEDIYDKTTRDLVDWWQRHCLADKERSK